MSNPTPIYNLEINDALERLQSSHKGLSKSVAHTRLTQYGANELTSRRTSWLKRLLEPFASYFAMVIVVAALLSLYERKWFEAIIISVIIVINALIYYFQQFSVSRVLKTLRSQDKQSVNVIRDGQELTVASEKLVPGDIVHVHEGIKVPADGRLIDVSHLQADESLLTGESLPIHKQASAIAGNQEVYDQKNMLFKGTYVRAGTGILLITKTGNSTQLGTINTLAAGADQDKTPIQAKIDDLTRKLLIGITCVSVAVFALAIVRGIHLDEALRFTLSLVVSAVPEGLPVAMTLVLLLSANRMAKQKALVKNLSAMETMGAVTLIVTDKTGTITRNQLSIADTYTNHKNQDDFKLAVSASLNGNKDHSTDPLDQLFLNTFPAINVKGWKKVHDFPFDQQLRLSAVVWQTGSSYMLYIKGAPEKILEHAKHSTNDLQVLESFVEKGQRTIGFASKKLSVVPQHLNGATLTNLNFEGYLSLSDQIRPNIQQSIKEAHEAGIKVIMLTGDHIKTAHFVGSQVGIVDNPSQVADSSSIAGKSTNKIREALVNTRVFGRVLPEHKYALLKAVKGVEITAMTGDGVNDIPALVEADAGLAMGSGADAAKDASDIVLINSNFHTIINTVRSGRTVLANIRKMVVYLLATSGGEVLTMLTALILNIPLPITAVMVLWVNLVTDGVSVIPLGLSPSESHQMRQPPRSPSSPLLSKVLLTRVFILAFTMAVTVLTVFKLNLGNGVAYAQTAAFLSLIVIQWANAFNMNFEYRSWTHNLFNPNYRLIAAIGVSIVVNTIVFNTGIRDFFGLAILSGKDAAIIILASVSAALIACDLHKLTVRLVKK